MIKRYSIILEVDTTTNEKKIISQKEIKAENLENLKKFEEFWELYPKKVGKSSCKKKFLRLGDGVVEKILASIPNHILFWKDREKEWRDKTNISSKTPYPFIPHPITWLNQERWEDEIEIKKKESINKDTKFVF